MSRERTVFIGAGNMAQSLIGGLIAQGRDPKTLIAADPDAGQRQRVAEHGVATMEDNAAALQGATQVVLAVKPQQMRSVVSALAPTLRDDQLLISIAAGIPVAALESWCGKAMPVIRCMPNTPALHGVGITALFANERVEAGQLAAARGTLAAAGRTVTVQAESELDAVTALSGSGPAYFFYVLEAMIAAGRELGLEEALARELAVETAYGAAVMVRAGAASPAELRRRVTSPGGTTERALAVLEDGAVGERFREAVREAARRASQLGAEFGAQSSDRSPSDG